MDTCHTFNMKMLQNLRTAESDIVLGIVAPKYDFVELYFEIKSFFIFFSTWMSFTSSVKRLGGQQAIQTNIKVMSKKFKSQIQFALNDSVSRSGFSRLKLVSSLISGFLLLNSFFNEYKRSLWPSVTKPLYYSYDGSNFTRCP